MSFGHWFKDYAGRELPSAHASILWPSIPKSLAGAEPWNVNTPEKHTLVLPWTDFDASGAERSFHVDGLHMLWTTLLGSLIHRQFLPNGNARTCFAIHSRRTPRFFCVACTGVPCLVLSHPTHLVSP